MPTPRPFIANPQRERRVRVRVPEASAAARENFLYFVKAPASPAQSLRAALARRPRDRQAG